nr:hypothetical protein [Paenibacillus vortex]
MQNLQPTYGRYEVALDQRSVRTDKSSLSRRYRKPNDARPDATLSMNTKFLTDI